MLGELNFDVAADQQRSEHSIWQDIVENNIAGRATRSSSGITAMYILCREANGNHTDCKSSSTRL
eukprot:4600295-Amphidinium_carterae.3